MRKEIPLGESEIVNGAIAVVGLAFCAAIGLFSWRALSTLTHLARPSCALLAGVIGLIGSFPFKLLRERFGYARLAFVGSSLLFYPHGWFWFARKLPTSTIQSIYEERLSAAADDADLGPRWRLVFERTDGTRTELGNFRNERIHDVVDDLRSFVRAQRDPEDIRG